MGVRFRMYLIKARLSKGYSMRKVSRLVNITHQHYSRIESGHSKSRLSFLLMGKIARVLDISIDEFWEEEYKYLLENYPEAINKEVFDY